MSENLNGELNQDLKQNLSEDSELRRYLREGVEGIVRGALRSTWKNPRETAFLVRYASVSRALQRRRDEGERRGLHVPPFLIASIAWRCNLRCLGCYAWENHICGETENPGELTAEEWGRIFQEAHEMGVGFILLAGGEPLTRRDVMEAAARHAGLIFPIFTNGTLVDEEYLAMFDRCRNLVPILSVEGTEEETDRRRGRGTYGRLTEDMEAFEKRGILFGVSVTVTTDNLNSVLGNDFLDLLRRRGCRAVIFVEYVPVDASTQSLALGSEEREFMEEELSRIRGEGEAMLLISFPGDEKRSGGCLAAGRGFFHINPFGGVEPCPFSPFSEISVRDHSLREALESSLFQRLREEGMLSETHQGGCVLFAQEERVRELLSRGEREITGGDAGR